MARPASPLVAASRPATSAKSSPSNAGTTSRSASTCPSGVTSRGRGWVSRRSMVRELWPIYSACGPLKRIRMAEGTLPPKDGPDDRTHRSRMAGGIGGRRGGQHLAQRSGRRQGQERPEGTEESIARAESHATDRVFPREDGCFSGAEGGFGRDR